MVIEQVENGVETGFAAVNANEFLDNVASTWREHDRLDVLLLRAICRLSADKPVQAGDGFTSHDIVEAIGRIRGRSWSSGDDKDQMSDDVRRLWSKLITTWGAKAEGISQRVSDSGLGVVPRLGKTEGGGSGRPSRYRIDWIPVEDVDIQPPTAITQPLTSASTDTLKYICEDIEDANVFARVFAKEYSLSGWRKWLFIAAIGAPLFLCFAVCVILIFAITMRTATGNPVVMNALLTFLVASFTTWYTIAPLLALSTDKIVIAPWWMQSINDDRLLEHRYPPRYPGRSIKMVRYTASCPTCGGIVTTRSGGLRFWDRIVGRCEHAPKEHVYSFDHVTRLGSSLR